MYLIVPGLIPVDHPLWPPMHIPDGFLSLPVAAILWAASLVLVAIAIARTRGSLGERSIPLMGTLAAFIFAAQMINFPVAGGTSGHLLGGTLAAILLGPWAAILVMASVIGVQGLLFQDGGLWVMGANWFNMGITSALLGYALYRIFLGLAADRLWGVSLAAAIASWGSVVVAAALTAIELALSDTSPLMVALPAMLGVHVLIGIGEALITVAALSFIAATRRDLLVSLPRLTGGRG